MCLIKRRNVHQSGGGGGGGINWIISCVFPRSCCVLFPKVLSAAFCALLFFHSAGWGGGGGGGGREGVRSVQTTLVKPSKITGK